jgi:hypothetical protein
MNKKPMKYICIPLTVIFISSILSELNNRTIGLGNNVPVAKKIAPNIPAVISPNYRTLLTLSNFPAP